MQCCIMTRRTTLLIAAVFGIPLTEALRSGLEGNLQKLCLALVENRQENGKVNVEKARKMAMVSDRFSHE